MPLGRTPDVKGCANAAMAWMPKSGLVLTRSQTSCLCNGHPLTVLLETLCQVPRVGFLAARCVGSPQVASIRLLPGVKFSVASHCMVVLYIDIAVHIWTWLHIDMSRCRQSERMLSRCALACLFVDVGDRYRQSAYYHCYVSRRIQ